MPTKIGVVGCVGRMGQMLVREVLHTKGTILTAVGDRAQSPAIGLDIGTTIGLPGLNQMIRVIDESFFADCDIVIDFTRPEASLFHASLAAKHGTKLVIGTTGLDKSQEAMLHEAANRTAIIYAANMSVGVNLLLALVEKVAAALPDQDFDAEIVEMHHKHKVDAPSGTALALGRAVASGRGVTLDDMAVMARQGQTGPRVTGEIGFATLRGGDVVGDHSVIFAGVGERIDISNHASDRRIFTKGAMRAALWLAGQQEKGLFSMRDVLGI